MSIRRIALIFDDILRPDTTGVYVRRALETLAEVVHFRPGQRREIPDTGFDFYLSIDDDTDHRLPETRLAGSAPTDSITRKLFALIARCHQMLGNLPAALAVCTEGLSFDPDDAETHWRRILTLGRPEHFSSLDEGIFGHLTRRNLAVLAEERGERGEAAGLWRRILAECPGDREALAKLERLESGEAAP
jgi:hypothetical protein